MNELKIFENPEFGKVRTVAIDGEPWFALKDVCQAFGETNYRRVASRLDEDEKGVSQIDTPGGKQSMTIVNESGLYAALFAMQPEKARGVSQAHIEHRQAKLKAFKHWVTSEVLPSIRKTGSYMTPQAQAGLAETVKALADKVEKLEDRHPAVVYSKDPPVVSLTGLAKVIINTRRILLDRGSSSEDIWRVTRSILNTCGFSIPALKGTLDLDFFDFW